jgi:hypothetical protein
MPTPIATGIAQASMEYCVDNENHLNSDGFDTVLKKRLRAVR